MPSIAIIIPCYNEAKRLNKNAFSDFLSLHNNVHFYFVNDGSTDDTTKVLQQFKENLPQVHIVSLENNSGKGEAVRQGLLTAEQTQGFEYIGYLDADLSTSINEFYKIYEIGIEKKADFIFGSRIKKLDSKIQRSFLRHIIGRILATIIDKRFELGCYDTQCGAKIFKTEMLYNLISKPFFTKWFFDVELFIRIKNAGKTYNGYEYPLSVWKNVKGSKINLFSSPAVLKDLFTLLAKY